MPTSGYAIQNPCPEAVRSTPQHPYEELPYWGPAPPMKMTDIAYEGLGVLVTLAFWFLAFVFPVLLYRTRRRTTRSEYALSMAVFGTWGLLIVYRILTARFSVDYQRSHLDINSEEYAMLDGVAGNVLILFAGWVPPLLSLGICYTASECLRAWCQRDAKPPEPPVTPGQ